MWKYYALLSAVFASLTALLAKVGVRGIDSNLATAIRVSVVLPLVWGMVLLTGALKGIRDLSGHNWLFLCLSGMATGLSWLFYFKALQMGRRVQGGPHRQAQRGPDHFSVHSALGRARRFKVVWAGADYLRLTGTGPIAAAEAPFAPCDASAADRRRSDVRADPP